MKFSAVFPFLLGAFVLIGSAVTATKNPAMFLNLQAAFVVFGGTFAAAAISFGLDRLWVLVRVTYVRILRGGKGFDPVNLIRELMQFSEAYRTNSPQLENMIKECKDPVLQDAMQALTEQVLTPEELMTSLRTRTESTYQRFLEEALKFKALAKFPPAFGLMGAVMGMVDIMSALGSEGAGSTVGPALALALLGTLYGVALANLGILPIGESLMDGAREARLKYSIVAEGIHLILQKKHPIVVAEELNSFLLAKERINWREVVKNERIGA
jgi:chemotaxis protein MotA